MLGPLLIATLAMGVPEAVSPILRIGAEQADVTWLGEQTAGELARDYPPKALSYWLSGEATLSCAISSDGKSADCKPIHEAPEGLGFGAASVKLATHLALRPRTASPDGRYELRIRWSLPPPPAMEPCPEALVAPRYYPEIAQRRHLEGAAEVLCEVAPIANGNASGKVKACGVLGEKPAGLGFGKAALTVGCLMKNIRPNRWAESGLILVPLDFKLPD